MLEGGVVGQGDPFCRLVYPVAAGVVVGGEDPKYIVCVYGDGQHVGERNPRDVQFPEGLHLLLVAVKIPVVFHDEQVVVVGLNPQYVFSGFHDAADHVAGQYCFGRVDRAVHMQAVAVEDIQSVARPDPNGALPVLVER